MKKNEKTINEKGKTMETKDKRKVKKGKREKNGRNRIDK